MSRITSRSLYELGPAELIPLGEGRTFDVDGTYIAVFRTRQGRFYATQAFCPHKGGPLADGLVGQCTVICPLHAFKFSLETGEPIGNSCAALRTYTVDVDPQGNLILHLDLEGE